MSPDPTFIDTMKTAAVASIVWIGGESGRIIVAGGAGGVTRWFQSERRRIRDGIVAAVGGAISATYLWPIPLMILGQIVGPMEPSPDNTAMAAFLTGALGMSFVKVLTAMIEAKAARNGDADA